VIGCELFLPVSVDTKRCELCTTSPHGRSAHSLKQSTNRPISQAKHFFTLFRFSF